IRHSARICQDMHLRAPILLARLPRIELLAECLVFRKLVLRLLGESVARRRILPSQVRVDVDALRAQLRPRFPLPLLKPSDPAERLGITRLSVWQLSLGPREEGVDRRLNAPISRLQAARLGIPGSPSAVDPPVRPNLGLGDGRGWIGARCTG